MKVGQTLKIRFIGSNNNFVHPMHLHGGPFTVVARDGEVIPKSARFLADTVNVMMNSCAGPWEKAQC
jgi:FtsP/CotA-like multicopper oxidase with cupredoxin domain